MSFLNRTEELSLLAKHVGKGVFGFITGRRRIGKTALLRQLCQKYNGFYHQAIESSPLEQISILSDEIKTQVPIFNKVSPKNWHEFFSLLTQSTLPKLIVLDEFPYLAKTDPSLPSILQKWIDHDLPKKKTLLLVSGSSQTMMHSQFLNGKSPLYGRAQVNLSMMPMRYHWFCVALGLKSGDPKAFTYYSLVGGIPHYWNFVEKIDVTQLVYKLYFDLSPSLIDEPKFIFHDECLTGTMPKAIVDLIGRGASKPSEIASRMQTQQVNLSRPLAQLLDLNLIQRELPFGESLRTTKKVHYLLHDPVLSFYYGTYLPHKSRWDVYSKQEKTTLIETHVSHQWEIFCRQFYSGASRYWEGDVEIDLVAPLSKSKHLVAECKWRHLTKKEEQQLLDKLKYKFQKTKLSKQIKNVTFKILSKNNLAELA